MRVVTAIKSQYFDKNTTLETFIITLGEIYY